MQQRSKSTINNSATTDSNDNEVLDSDRQEALIKEFWTEKGKQDRLWRNSLFGLAIFIIIIYLQLLFYPALHQVSAIQYHSITVKLKISEFSRAVLYFLNISSIILISYLVYLKIRPSRDSTWKPNNTANNNNLINHPNQTVNTISFDFDNPQFVSYLTFLAVFICCACWLVILVLNKTFQMALFLPLFMVVAYYCLSFYAITQSFDTEREIKQLEKLKYNLHTA